MNQSNITTFIFVQNIETHRRKWDKDEFEKLARERLAEEDEDDDLKSLKKEPPVKRDLLKPREYKVNSLIIMEVYSNV